MNAHNYAAAAAAEICDARSTCAIWPRAVGVGGVVVVLSACCSVVDIY